MKYLVVILVACLQVVSGFAEQQTNTLSKAERLRMSTGGFVFDRRKADGQVVFVNAQKRVSKDVLAAHVERLERECMMTMKVEDSEPFVLQDAAGKIKAVNANLAVFILDSDLPVSMMLAPDQKYAVVNVKELAKDSPSSEKLEMRVKKQMVRAVALLFGTGYAVAGDGTVMPVNGLEGLDELPLMILPVSVTSTMLKFASEKFGIRPFRRTFYVYALKEGWAPPPKGKYQKMLWEQYNAKPTQPMRIKFDPKQGK